MSVVGAGLIVSGGELDALQDHFVAADDPGAKVTACGAQQAIRPYRGRRVAHGAADDHVCIFNLEFSLLRNRSGGSERVGVSQQRGLDSRQRSDAHDDSRDCACTTLRGDLLDLLDQRVAD
jgi:hypothetical protein